MKTTFVSTPTTKFENLSFDILTSEELASIKGGKSDDSYVDLT